MLPESVQAKLDTLPAAPGVYVFRDRAGGVLYVGKARSLRSRVRSYFTPGRSDDRFFVEFLEAELGDLETFVVGNEKEAALLENELIKERQPRYNVKLKDDKDFLSIRLDPAQEWPRLTVVRRPRPDGARYFGPYDSATSARRTLRLVNRHFKLRTCRDSELRSRVRPCLQYQIKRCPAPCVKEVDRDEYVEQTRLVGLFLEGRHDQLVEDLEGRMRGAASELAFERAAQYRDQLRAVDRARAHQRITVVKDVDQDVVGLYREGDRVEVALLGVRGGHLVSVRTFALPGRLPDEEILAGLVAELYGSGSAIPDELVLPAALEAMDGVAAWLSDTRGARVTLWVPQRGPRRRLADLARENAEHAFREKARAKEDLEARLAAVQKKLRLPRPPRRIECVDVSHSAGKDTVAAVTAMSDGELDRARYRTFTIKRAAPGDDYAAMYEVLARRIRRGKDEDARWGLPDLLVVDGGKGQLGVALTVLRDLGVTDLPVVGLAKERVDASGREQPERVFLPGQANPVRLDARSPALHFLARVRDEAHRVSNLHREKRGARRQLTSELDLVPGVGQKTRQKLLRALGSLEQVMRADHEALRAAGATERQAQAILRAFHGASEPEALADAERAAADNAFDDG